GHSFGLGDNNDSTSVMFSTYHGTLSGLSASDTAALQSLYGPRAADAYAGPTGNATLANAAVMNLPEIAGDLTSAKEVDYYRYAVPSYADRTVTVTVQTGGISLLAPRLNVYTASGQLIATSSAAD